jgi:hypothetical protein
MFSCNATSVVSLWYLYDLLSAALNRKYRRRKKGRAYGLGKPEQVSCVRCWDAPSYVLWRFLDDNEAARLAL